MSRTIIKSITVPVIFFLLSMNLTVPSAQAAMVGTEKVLNISRNQEIRSRINNLLERHEVQKALEIQGIAPAEAKARIDSLSESEVLHLGERLDQLPAGGGGVGAVIGAAVLIFIILLFTDILGLTHVFPFVNHGSIPAKK